MAFSPDHATNEVHSFSITATANGKSSTMGPIDIEIIDQTSPLINSSQLLTSISIGGTNLGQVSANENVTWYFDSGGTDKTVDADGNVTLTAGASWINGVEDYVLRAEDDEGASTTTDVISVEVGTWNQIGLDIDGEAADDESGHSVSLSGDGSVVAIGAPYNSGVSGANSGHVRVYENNNNNNNTWQQKGQEIDGAAENVVKKWAC